jgi:hypothetical protein
MSPLPLKFETSFGFQTSHVPSNCESRFHFAASRAVVSRDFRLALRFKQRLARLKLFAASGENPCLHSFFAHQGSRCVKIFAR